MTARGNAKTISQAFPWADATTPSHSTARLPVSKKCALYQHFCFIAIYLAIQGVIVISSHSSRSFQVQVSV